MGSRAAPHFAKAAEVVKAHEVVGVRMGEEHGIDPVQPPPRAGPARAAPAWHQ